MAVLGILVTIVSYGSWYYAFGVLLDPILDATGWSESTVAASFSVGVVANGFASMLGGRWLDRVGSRLVLLAGGLGGGAALLMTSVAPNPLLFALASAVAMGFLGGFGFYHITMTTAVRLNPEASARAIAVLTIWGAFASAIYLPVTAALVSRLEWRATVRWLAVVVLAVFALAALVIPRRERSATARAGAPGTPDQGAPAPAPSIREVLISTVDGPERRTFTAVVGLGGIAMATLLVYQVPTMTAAGLPLATAASMAGIRGVAQTLGRVPLGRLIGWVGSDGALVAALGSLVVGGGLLAVASNVPVALAFAVLAGFGIGAYSPLQGIKSEELFDRRSLGATMGAYSTIMMLVGAVGPATAGWLADATDDRRVAVLVIVGSAAGGTALAIRLRALSGPAV